MSYFLTILGVLIECDNCYTDVLRIIFKNKDNALKFSVIYCCKKANCDIGKVIFKQILAKSGVTFYFYKSPSKQKLVLAQR